MPVIDRHKSIYLVVLLSLLLASLACRVEAPRIILEETPTDQPTQVIVQVITEIVTPTPQIATPPALPSPTPEPTLTPTWDPLSAPIYYPLKGCAASRLHIGGQAMVSLVGGPNAIRSSADVRAETNIISYAQPGEVLNIVAGPWCDLGYLIWLIETQDGIRGYTPEGDGYTYWLFPTAP